MANRMHLRLVAFALTAAMIGAGIVKAQDTPSTLDQAVSGMSDAADARDNDAVVDRIASDFAEFAGSESNADALVRGLRSGSEITLEQGGAATSFTPATGHLGYGEVQISLSLAKALLERDGIIEPSPAQIAAALNGGDVTLADGSVVTYRGLLAQRADGSGWGQIANAEGFKLGPVIATMRSGKDHLSRLAAKTAGTDAGAVRAGKSQRAQKPEHAGSADRANRPERPMRAERPQKPERPMRVERPDKPDRPGKS